MLTEAEIREIRPARYVRKVTDGRGLHLLVRPTGTRSWRFAYRFAGKYKALGLGTYPEVSLEWARSRHEFARNLLDHGIDPCALQAAIGKHRFGVTMREWEADQGRTHAGIFLCPLCSGLKPKPKLAA
jgi:Arm DNA-binding domain